MRRFRDVAEVVFWISVTVAIWFLMIGVVVVAIRALG